MPLRPVPDPDDWAEEIVEVALAEMNAAIDIVTVAPGAMADDGTISDPTITTVIARRPARIQPMRYPQASDAAAATVVRRHYIFQMEMRAGDGAIEPGMTIRVQDGGRDPLLQRYTFVVLIAASSSWAPVYTIQAYAEFSNGS